MPSPESMVQDSGQPLPWHKQFWPWFLIGLPALAVVASLTTVYIAFTKKDSLVVDDYYREGLAINRVLDEDRMALKLRLGAELKVNLGTGHIDASLSGDVDSMPDTLVLKWLHPVNAKRDLAVTLHKVARARFEGQVNSPLQGRWYIQLIGKSPKPWLLRSQARIGNVSQVRLLLGSLPRDKSVTGNNQGFSGGSKIAGGGHGVKTLR